MALLSEKQRKDYFKALGLGDYNKANILKLQKQYFTRKKDLDGIYGQNTDNLLRHVYNVKTFSKNFKPQEFKCECGGRGCTGYPTFMKDFQMKHLQTIRDHWGRPMQVTSGMRCRWYNSHIGGSISNSLHLQGQATDFYIRGVTDTLANRRKAIKYIKTLKRHHYTYGNGCSSVAGRNPHAHYMGNALHSDTR